MASKYYHELNKEELRIVLVGKTGNGKSATGNTILGQQCFESKFSAKSMTVDSLMGKAEVDGQRVVVIDTPGLFNTRFGMDKTTKDICQCIVYAAPGPHVFLVVIRLGRYTEEEKQTVQRIQEIFGQAADRHSMVLFTHGDDLEDTTIKDFLTESSELQELVARCNGQYHVFNNELKDRSQVTELLQKIRNLVQKNGGSHYTNEMFQEAERAIEEEKQRILKEKEEQIRKEKEEVERKLQEKYEKEMKKINEQLQAERERERRKREEEERRRERERERERWEMEMERRRDREGREAERKREEQERERQIANMRKQHERELEEERERLRREAQRQAERNDDDDDDDDCTCIERERERKEREEERKREKQEMNEERKREKEEREAEREREREEKEREFTNMMNELNEQHERELRAEVEKLQSRYENEAREEAEEFNPFLIHFWLCKFL